MGLLILASEQEENAGVEQSWQSSTNTFCLNGNSFWIIISTVGSSNGTEKRGNDNSQPSISGFVVNISHLVD